MFILGVRSAPVINHDPINQSVWQNSWTGEFGGRVHCTCFVILLITYLFENFTWSLEKKLFLFSCLAPPLSVSYYRLVIFSLDTRPHKSRLNKASGLHVLHCPSFPYLFFSFSSTFKKLLSILKADVVPFPKSKCFIFFEFCQNSNQRYRMKKLGMRETVGEKEWVRKKRLLTRSIPLVVLLISPSVSWNNSHAFLSGSTYFSPVVTQAKWKLFYREDVAWSLKGWEASRSVYIHLVLKQHRRIVSAESSSFLVNRNGWDPRVCITLVETLRQSFSISAPEHSACM